MKIFNKIGVIIVFASSMLYLQVNAQKLPRVQKVSLRAPGNAVADGKATEWNNQFQAYNNSTEVFYTIANDNEKLYLVIQATKSIIISNILHGGITFTINNFAEKKTKNPVAITYPMINKKDVFGISRMLHLPKNITDTSLMKKQADTLMYAFNTEFKAKSKLFMVQGIKSIDDTLLSVYNLDGIKAVALLNNKMAYTYELAIPLKYLYAVIGADGKFNYNVRVNYSPPAFGSTSAKDIESINITGNTATITGKDGSQQTVELNTGASTDFSGEYTLMRGE